MAEAVPVERLKALLRLLYPEEMTPVAHRMFSQVVAVRLPIRP